MNKKTLVIIVIIVIVVGWMVFGNSREAHYREMALVRDVTPLGVNGQLHVCGNHLCNDSNQVIQLRSMAAVGGLFVERCADAATINYAASLGADVIRYPVATDRYDSGDNSKIIAAVNAARDVGVYIILDWHKVGNPLQYESAGIQFFSWASKQFAGYENVLYETFNEPVSDSWKELRQYHNRMIAVIRANDPDAVILVSSEHYSQQPLFNPSAIASNPVDDNNVMYVTHFYSAWMQSNPNGGLLTRAAGMLPLFVTEWGFFPSEVGMGGYQDKAGQIWVDEMHDLSIPWVSWWFVSGESFFPFFLNW